MMIYVPGKFPGMNEIVKVSKIHFGAYSGMKKKYTLIFSLALSGFKPRSEPVDIGIKWIYKEKRRDPDNIMAGQKFILDGLVNNGVLKNDTLSDINSLNHSFARGDEDGVEITIE